MDSEVGITETQTKNQTRPGKTKGSLFFLFYFLSYPPLSSSPTPPTRTLLSHSSFTTSSLLSPCLIFMPLPLPLSQFYLDSLRSIFLSLIFRLNLVVLHECFFFSLSLSLSLTRSFLPSSSCPPLLLPSTFPSLFLFLCFSPLSLCLFPLLPSS